MDYQQFFGACCPREHQLLRKVFAAVPEDGLDYRPEPKARSSRELMGHLIGHLQDLIELADDGVINHRNVVPFGSRDEALAMLDQAIETLEAKTAAATPDDWNRDAKMQMGDHVIWEAPAGQLYWGMLFDTIHHRGQLSTYLRPMGSTVPSMYGPSADDDGS